MKEFSRLEIQEHSLPRKIPINLENWKIGLMGEKCQKMQSYDKQFKENVKLTLYQRTLLANIAMQLSRKWASLELHK